MTRLWKRVNDPRYTIDKATTGEPDAAPQALVKDATRVRRKLLRDGSLIDIAPTGEKTFMETITVYYNPAQQRIQALQVSLWLPMQPGQRQTHTDISWIDMGGSGSIDKGGEPIFPGSNAIQRRDPHARPFI